jgi:hypothetical protein
MSIKYFHMDCGVVRARRDCPCVSPSSRRRGLTVSTLASLPCPVFVPAVSVCNFLGTSFPAVVLKGWEEVGPTFATPELIVYEDGEAPRVKFLCEEAENTSAFVSLFPGIMDFQKTTRTTSSVVIPLDGFVQVSGDLVTRFRSLC